MPTIIPPNNEITGLLPSFQYAGKEYVMVGAAILCIKCGLYQTVALALGEGVKDLHITLQPNHSLICNQ